MTRSGSCGPDLWIDPSSYKSGYRKLEIHFSGNRVNQDLPEIVQFRDSEVVSLRTESLLERGWNLQKTQAITPLADVAGLDKNILTGKHNI